MYIDKSDSGILLVAVSRMHELNRSRGANVSQNLIWFPDLQWSIRVLSGYAKRQNARLPNHISFPESEHD